MTRPIDAALATAGLVFMAPVMALLALAIKVESPGPILYRATRVGRHGGTFTMLKFRTMRVGADAGGALTRVADPRLTRVGRWLRRTALDELPQLINIVRGEMAFVGPRPEDPRYVAGYTAEQRRVLTVRPGLTSLASLAFRDEAERLTGDQWERTYTEQIMPAKLAMELEYMDTADPWSDLRVIVTTILVLLGGQGRDR